MSTTAVAYRLTDEHELATYGGTTHLRDGLALDIKAALEEGARPVDADTDWQPAAGDRGVLVTDDPIVIDALDGRQDLERIQVPEGAKVTSHQLQPTLAEQHDRDKTGVPTIATELGAMSGAEIAAAQLRGDLPVPTEPPPDAYDAAPGAGSPPPPPPGDASAPASGAGEQTQTAPAAGAGAQTGGGAAARAPRTSETGSR